MYRQENKKYAKFPLCTEQTWDILLMVNESKVIFI